MAYTRTAIPYEHPARRQVILAFRYIQNCCRNETRVLEPGHRLPATLIPALINTRLLNGEFRGRNKATALKRLAGAMVAVADQVVPPTTTAVEERSRRKICTATSKGRRRKIWTRAEEKSDGTGGRARASLHSSGVRSAKILKEERK